MTNQSLLIDLHYFGNISYYKKLCSGRYIVFEQYAGHKKKSFANRLLISGANGQITLSVPLEKGRAQKNLYKDVRISNVENWQQRHWKSLVSCYNNAPWFEFYRDDLSAIFSKRFDFLLDWNLACLGYMSQCLKVNLRYQLSDILVIMPSQEMEDLRNSIVPNNAAATGNMRYSQVFEDKFGFQPDLCILDLLFCAGPKISVSLLRDQG